MASPFLTAGATTGDSGGELSSGDDSGDVESRQSPETEASGSLAELFEQAAAHLQGLVQVASREQLLYLYARYKQVKVGNCNTPKPSFFDFEGKQKWEAWKALGDSSPSQAMQEYIAVVKKLDPGWNPQSPEKKGKEANTGFGGPVVSSLYHEEIIREEDKNIFDYCRENNIDHVTKVIRSKNVDVNMKDEEGRTLLHWACDRGHKELVTVLLRYKADINCQVISTQAQLPSDCGMMKVKQLYIMVQGCAQTSGVLNSHPVYEDVTTIMLLPVSFWTL
ncbi:acyl-CoA-binding domain-containing protein 6 isoform X3 [Canis lupus baileyi]|uniref:acyl-CoA-binding domain-containing protein 6 isoform X3 n=2 Tax=Canis lupus familiaris TaxID=9615 RepID=UPI000BAA1929|nr:acyl-CoA-binding domain-containing protein 6 isoform X3 [Canis lupus familiaris]XP_025285738.2 acyl-CoA-binding domain-containing protein 6 isoform X4 [Canis lupus dingo]|eukprot:XP_022276623.1 acyl-CoA-binding domain-containing protein 6 isoform X4 [Canis lupus familiaris]